MNAPAVSCTGIGRPGPGSPDRLGLELDAEGATVAVFSANAERIELCLFDRAGRETQRLALPEHTGGVWHGHVPGIRAGQLYGLRAHGPYAPAEGHRFNPNKLLVDPHARALSGTLRHHDAIFGYARGHPDGHLSYDSRDSAPFVPKCVALPAVSVPAMRPRRDWGETLIYEAHLKGLTMTMPGVPEAVRGTWDALGHPSVVAHLTALGVTAVELLPVQAIADEPALAARGLTNYWGYSTLAFGAPHPAYLGPDGLDGMRAAIARLHGAGIEVILDIVLNHSAEGDAWGPTLSFRGLDNARYYRLERDDPAGYENHTGCGNTLDLSDPAMLRLAMDSLRRWVESYGVDGFRFDLAPSLARGPEGGFDPNAAFLQTLGQDPVLSGCRLIAEPWDIGPGGYRLGAFPPGFAEWNDRFRDDVRRFWLGAPGSAPDLARRLMGSAEIFEHAGRRPWASVNLVTAHDGFTLADLTSYAEKHNAANGDANRDGHDGNLSDNLGIEGPTEDLAIRDARALRRRNLLATLFLSQGTPMLLAGDEIANSQAGNNNAYCQDNATGWVDWAHADRDLLAFVRQLAALRRAHGVLRQTHFLHGAIRRADGLPDVAWQALDGGEPDWQSPDLRALCLRVRGAAARPDGIAADGDLLIAINGSDADIGLVLPDPGAGRVWRRVLDTARPDAPASAPDGLARQAVAVFSAEPDGGTAR